mgnify:CR=1 FL=1
MRTSRYDRRRQDVGRPDLELHDEFPSAHERAEIRLRTLSNGSTAVVRQCLDCGIQVGPSLPKAQAPRTIVMFDATIAERHERAWRNRIADQQIVEQDARREQYGAYLASPAWAERRAKVLRRDGGICQACLERRATDVHHLNYRRFGREPAFDLVAVCRQCHDEIHEAGHAAP